MLLCFWCHFSVYRTGQQNKIKAVFKFRSKCGFTLPVNRSKIIQFSNDHKNFIDLRLPMEKMISILSMIKNSRETPLRWGFFWRYRELGALPFPPSAPVKSGFHSGIHLSVRRWNNVNRKISWCFHQKLAPAVAPDSNFEGYCGFCIVCCAFLSTVLGYELKILKAELSSGQLTNSCNSLLPLASVSFWRFPIGTCFH
jgi:hypothetical protein